MNDIDFRQMIFLFGSGLGLLSLGLLAVFVRQFGQMTRVVTASVASCAAAAIPLFADLPDVALRSAGITAVMALLTSAACLSRIERGFSRAFTFVQNAWVPTAGLSVIGVSLFVASLARFEIQQEAHLEDDSRWMQEAVDIPTQKVVLAWSAKSDRGQPIRLLQPTEPRTRQQIGEREALVLSHIAASSRIIRRGEASDEFNCYGWVFTGGKHWLDPDAVETILKDNGYFQVSYPLPGDLAIYRQRGIIQHTAIVRGSLDGVGTMVEGKWGWLGVFVHHVDDSCYGAEYEFYRSHRDGHLIAGLADSPPRKSTYTASEADDYFDSEE